MTWKKGMGLWRISLGARQKLRGKFFGESTNQKLGNALPGMIKDDVPRLAVLGPVYGRVLIRNSRRQNPVFVNILLCAALVKTGWSTTPTAGSAR